MPVNEKNEEVNWIARESKLMEESDLKRIWQLTEGYKSDRPGDPQQSLKSFQFRLNQSDVDLVSIESKRWNYYFIRIAAAFLILIAAFFVIKGGLKLTEQTQIVRAESGIQKVITLADGSKVTLNENSIIKFSSNFNNKDRKINLIGEAFFEVKSNPSKPFHVETDLANIKVIGTSFNVRAYENEEVVEVYVNTGKVSVTPSQGETAILETGEYLTIVKGIVKPKVVVDENGNAMAWSRGKLIFKRTPFREVFKSIEKEFKVQIDVTDMAILDCLYTQSIELKRKRLNETFKAMQIACPLKIVEEKPDYFKVSGKCCNE